MISRFTKAQPESLQTSVGCQHGRAEQHLPQCFSNSHTDTCMQALPESATTEHRQIMVFLHACFVCHAIAYFDLNTSKCTGAHSRCSFRGAAGCAQRVRRADSGGAGHVLNDLNAATVL